MKDRVAELLDKYWAGDTSLKEEAELRSLLKESKDYPELSPFFLGVEQLSALEVNLDKPTKSRIIGTVFLSKIAAVFIGLVVVGSLLYSDYRRREQEKAYVQVMEAFALIQSNMEKGTAELQIMGELRHLNTAKELFNIYEMKEK